MMFENPLTSPLFTPVVVRLGVLFGVTFLVILAVVRGKIKLLVQNILFKRWRTWIIITPIYLLAVLAGSFPSLIFTLAITMQGIREYALMTKLPGPYRQVLYAFALLPAPLALFSTDLFYLLPPLLLLLAMAQPVIFRVEGGVRHLAFSALGWAYLAWFLSHFIIIARWENAGPGFLLALGLGVAISDVAAFVMGKILGRHKMTPRISPNKTWEGIIGNLLGAYLGVVLLAFALPTDNRPILLLFFPLVVAFGAVWGDLIESSMKREFGVKDTASWLSGFGGLLDRIDSLLIVLPLSYYFLRVLMYFD